MTLFEKSLVTIELPQVLEMLSAQAATAGGKERALKLTPSTDRYEVEGWLHETTAAKKMMEASRKPVSWRNLRRIRFGVPR